MPTRSKDSWVWGLFYAIAAVFAVLSVGAIFRYTDVDSQRRETAPTKALFGLGGSGYPSVPADIPRAQIADEPSYFSAGEVPLKHLHSAPVLSPDRFASADGATGVLYFSSTTEGLLSESVPASLPPMVSPVLFTGRAENSFEAVAVEWLAKHSPNWSADHARCVERELRQNVFPWIGAKPVGELTSPELLSVVRRVEEGGRLKMAHRVLQTCGRVLSYAVATGRAGRDISWDLRGALPPAPADFVVGRWDLNLAGAVSQGGPSCRDFPVRTSGVFPVSGLIFEELS